jgi:hypothetical protein
MRFLLLRFSLVASSLFMLGCQIEPSWHFSIEERKAELRLTEHTALDFTEPELVFNCPVRAGGIVCSSSAAAR